MTPNYTQRVQTAQEHLGSGEMQLISDSLDIFYLTGFHCLTPKEREAFLLLTQHSAQLFLSSFSAPVHVQNVQVLLGGIERLLSEHLPLLVKNHQLQTLLIDGQNTTVSEYEFLQKILKKTVSMTTQQHSLLSQDRVIKDETEIQALKTANALTHKALSYTLEQLQAGLTELEVQNIFEETLRKHGIKQLAFPTIVCFGEHAALPHHQPDSTRLQQNQAVLIDCGANWLGYCADVTRTIWFGNHPDPQFLQIQKVVMDSYNLVLDTYHKRAKQGQTMTAADLDTLARDHITAAGFGNQFIHTTGHGVGLYIHEAPSLNFRNDTPIHQNMVITVEPGIYLDGNFGFRYENSLLVTKTQLQELLA